MGVQSSPAPTKKGAAQEDEIKEPEVPLARVAECAKRYDDMVAFIRSRSLDPTAVVGGKGGATADAEQLNSEERRLFSIAYRTAIKNRLKAWETAYQLEKDELCHTSNPRVKLARNFKEQVECEIESILQDLVQVVDVLIPKAKEAGRMDNACFFHTVMGDCNRYAMEMEPTEDGRQSRQQVAESQYASGRDCANDGLAAVDPTRLYNVLNHAVLIDSSGRTDEAIVMVERALKEVEEALEEYDPDDDPDAVEAQMLMQQLNDNLILWKGEPEPGEEDHQGNPEPEGDSEGQVEAEADVEGGAEDGSDGGTSEAPDNPSS